MTTVTPQQASELLDGIAPGRLMALDHYADGEKRPDTSRSMRTADGTYIGIMHTPYAELAAAAPELAEIVAGLRLEYDYEIFVAGEWFPAGHSFSTHEAAKKWVDTRRHSTPARIVRRLVSIPEVVE